MTSFEEVLRNPIAKKVLGHQLLLEEDSLPFLNGVVSRIDFLLRNPSNISPIAAVGNAALSAFLQSNITGPPLPFDSSDVVFPGAYTKQGTKFADLRKQLLESLSVDGEAVYEFAPNIELFWLAKCILNHEAAAKLPGGLRQRARINFVHQRLLTESSETLETLIYADLDLVNQDLIQREELEVHRPEESLAEFLVERATIHLYHGHDTKARDDLNQAAMKNGFTFALTGKLGKRTKYQQAELSQLVVLARSADEPAVKGVMHEPPKARIHKSSLQSTPDNLPLNDDTLLESVAFSSDSNTGNLPVVEESSALPLALASLDPGTQPLLSPLDSIILLSIASSITNTSPAGGLTREETLPYATRVLDGGSSNWQVYTQALLVRSRIEGYNSRTVERSLLQLQALVDQIIADTTHSSDSVTPSTFLPRPNLGNAAPAADRLRYIFALASPFRWTLESELASKWISMGGLKSAMDIYERLHMWPEVAMCLAATDQERKAALVVRRLLFEQGLPGQMTEGDTFEGPELAVLPPDAPRLLCILGDLEPAMSIQHYQRAWDISKGRYARAQRSLARLYAKQKIYLPAAEAYTKAIQVSRTDAPTWFAFGCIQLELEDWAGAASSFTQMVRLEETDAEGWSNLAVALLRLPVETQISSTQDIILPDEEDHKTAPTDSVKTNPYQNRLAALRALSRATSLKPTDARLWDNYLTVSNSLPPSLTPWPEIILAFNRLIALRGPASGESTIDVPILTRLVKHVISQPYSTFTKGSVPSNLISLMDHKVIPLITSSIELWHLVSQLSRWRNKPSSALDAEEKAWRIVTGRPGIYETQNGWKEAAEATIMLVEAYRQLGPEPKERLTNVVSSNQGPETNGGESTSVSVPVARDWKFKSRSALRSVVGKGKANGWDDSEAMERLQEVASGLSTGEKG